MAEREATGKCRSFHNHPILFGSGLVLPLPTSHFHFHPRSCRCPCPCAVCFRHAKCVWFPPSTPFSSRFSGDAAKRLFSWLISMPKTSMLPCTCVYLGVGPPFLVLSGVSSGVLAVCAVRFWQIIKLPRHRPGTTQNKVRNCLSFVSQWQV